MDNQLTKNSKPFQKPALQHNNAFGRTAPNALEMENKILGILMEFNSAYDTVSEFLKAESFYLENNQRIFEAISTLAVKRFSFDLIGTTEQLKKDGFLEAIGGPYELSKKTNSVTSMVGLESNCKIVAEKYILREIIRMNGELIDLAYEPGADAFEVLDYAETKIFDIAISNVTSDYIDLKTAMVSVVKRIEELQDLDEDITGVPSGYKTLDEKIHGWQPTDFIVLAARPSVGKSSFALNLARQAAMDKLKPTSVGFFSLEMSREQLVQRILSAQSGIWLSKLKTGKMEEYQMDVLIKKGVMALENAKVFIDDTASLTIQQLRSKVRRMVLKDNVGLIIIDYLQLMRSSNKENKGGNREQEISHISRELKGLAKELKIPIIALAQLSRDIEKRKEGSSKIPKLSDIRESGAIEQDADIVGFIYRPSVEERDLDADLATTAMVSIAKHRNGALVDVAFYVDDKIQKWDEVGVMPSIVVERVLQPVYIDYTEPRTKDDAPF